MVDNRLLELQNWLALVLKQQAYTIEPLAGDASFRRYFRLYQGQQTFVVMDALPEKEPCDSFIHINQLFASQKLHVPQLFAHDIEKGFILMSDLGDRLYSLELSSASASSLYQTALQDLMLIQTCKAELPFFDVAFMLNELNNFTYWYLQQHLKLSLSSKELSLLNKTYLLLAEEAANQPQVCVHRDYHSRNLLLLDNEQVGILDFQDAVRGPITYDAVSLLRDCYIDWPEKQVISWANDFYENLYKNGTLKRCGRQLFLRWFDWMGMQRHLKAIFIFARKLERDNNSNYLGDIPRALNYIRKVCLCYPEFKDFYQLLMDKGILRDNHISL